MRISFIGFGNMAKSLAEGLLQQGYNNIRASAPSLSKKIWPTGIHTHSNNKEVVPEADVLILAVKPGVMQSVLTEIAPLIPKECLVISVASGLPLSFFSTYLSASTALIRAMPNTPASVGFAATPLFANANTNAEQKNQAETIFKSIGIITWIEEEPLMDAFTAFSGSGPAYVCAFLEAFIKAGITQGIPEALAKEFGQQTFLGALTLIQKSSEPIATLRAKVTSKGGTTEAALTVLTPTLDKLLDEAIQAAVLRAQALGKS